MTFHSDHKLLHLLLSFRDLAVHDSVRDIIWTHTVEEDDEFVIVTN